MLWSESLTRGWWRGWRNITATSSEPADDLADPKLLEESRAALDELTKLLQIGSVYEFQRSISA